MKHIKFAYKIIYTFCAKKPNQKALSGNVSTTVAKANLQLMFCAKVSE